MHKSAKIVFGVVISVLITEILLRTVSIYSVNNINSVSNPSIFIAKSENIEIKEGYGVRVANSHGALDREFKNDKEIESRFLLFGDSFTEAFQVSNEHVYDNILEDQFAINGKKIEFANFGRSGHSTVDELDYYMHFANKIPHDGVMIQFSPNDFIGNLESKYNIDDKTLEITPNRWTNYANSNKSKVVYYLRRNSVLINLLFIRSYELIDVLFSDEVESEIFSKPRFEEIEKTRKVLKQFYEIARCNDVENVMLFQIPNLNNAEDNSDVEIRQICEDIGIKYIDINGEIVDYMNSENKKLNGFINTKFGYGHLNSFGHNFLGRALFSKMTGE